MRSVTYNPIADDDAIKTSIATVASPVSYTAGQLNGVIGVGVMNPPRSLSVTTSANTGTYVGTAIVVTGTDSQGRAQTETLTLTQVNGGETIFGTKEFRTVTQIDIPAQTDTAGTFKFGVRDIFLPKPPRSIRSQAAGNVKMSYSDGTTDTVPFLAGEKQDLQPAKIFGDGSTTATNLTLVFD